MSKASNVKRGADSQQRLGSAILGVESKLTKLVAQADELRKRRNSLKAKIKSDLLRHAQKKAIFRVGDIIEYTDGNPPILVTRIECYDDGEPTYRGLEVWNGKLTRRVRSTAGWGHQDTHDYGDGRKYPTKWKKVGDCEALRMVVPNRRMARISDRADNPRREYAN